MGAITFAGMAMDAVKEGKTADAAISSGRYAMVPIPIPTWAAQSESPPCTTQSATADLRSQAGPADFSDAGLCGGADVILAWR